MNKLLISLLSLTGVAGLSTGGYFLLRNSLEEDKKLEQDTKADGGEGKKVQKEEDSAPATSYNSGGQSGSSGGTGVPKNSAGSGGGGSPVAAK